MSGYTAAELKQQRGEIRHEALQLFQNRPKPLRQLGIAMIDVLLDPKHELRERVRWTDVPGKDGDENRERAMKLPFYGQVALLLCKLLSHMDIVTSDVGRGQDRKFYGLRVDTMTTWLKMSQRTTERIIFVLHRAGILRTWPHAERLDDDTYRGHVAVRKISIDLLLPHLGVGWFKAWREVQSSHNEKRHQDRKTARLAQDLANTGLDRIAAENAAGRTTAAPEPDDARSVGAVLRGLGARYGPKPA